MNNCTSLREVTQGIAAYGDKLNHLGINYTPPRSTFSEANARRSEEFFGAVYQKLYGHYKSGLSDSQNQNELLKRLFIIDSTTISLFKAILKCVGRKSIDGKSKGGIKVHTMLNAYEQIPQLIHFSDAATHDHTFLSKIKLQPHQIALFDKAYVDYRQYAKWTDKNIFFVTRLKDNAVYEQLNEIPIPDSIPPDYIKDQKVAIKYKGEHNTHCQLELRRVVYYDNEKDRVFEFLTNIMDMSAEQIGLLYKMRWQIEMLFKQLKQNFPLKYFLGDNENAIKIQIWCTLIANLLFTIVKKNINKKISFSNLVSFTRQHLFSYNKITDLIEKVERYWRKKYAGKPQIIPNLFDG
ncbi:MAG: IS4 family transposase [Flavisolibacter sp.]